MTAFKDWKPSDLEAHQRRVAAGKAKASEKSENKSGGEMPRVASCRTMLKTADNKPRAKSGYNKDVALAYFKSHGLPVPVTEYRFAHTIGRRWRFDFAWCSSPFKIYTLALEVQGGIFIQGRHSRGAAMLKEWEKLNEASCMGWRIIYCQPKDLMTQATIDVIKRCLEI